jgi:hypothetical protein
MEYGRYGALVSAVHSRGRDRRSWCLCQRRSVAVGLAVARGWVVGAAVGGETVAASGASFV